MRISVLMIVLICLSIFTIKGQEAPSMADSIEFTSIQIKNILNRTYSLGSPSNLQIAFGNAKITTKEIDQMSEESIYIYGYKGIEVYFKELNFGSVTATFELNFSSATISNSQYRLFLNGISYKLGDNINNLNKQFPVSFKNRQVNSDSQNRRIIIGTKNKNVETDTSIQITYDEQGFITEIWIGDKRW